MLIVSLVLAAVRGDLWALAKVIAMQFSLHAPWSHHDDGGSECPAPDLLFSSSSVKRATNMVGPNVGIWNSNGSLWRESV